MRGLLDNLALKLISLLLAVMVWFVIAGEKTSEMGLQVAVELQNFPKDLELTGEPVDAVEVRLRASPGIIQHLTASDVSAQIDVAGATEGEHIIHLTSDAIRVPFGVKVVKINPSTLTMHFERTLQKLVPVRPRLLGRPAPGFEVGATTADPVEVRVAGPRSRVDDVESAFTEPVSVEGARGALEQHVNIGLEDPVLRIQGNPRVRVTVSVQEVKGERTMSAVAVEVRGPAGSSSPARVLVVLSGPEAELDRLGDGDVHAFVQPEAGADATAVPVRVEIAPGHPGVAVVRTEPATVAVVSRGGRKG
jgi:YbbR domain-containing protein